MENTRHISKKLFSAFLSVCLCGACLPFSVFAANEDFRAMDERTGSLSDLPVRFNLLERGVVTPVKQQDPWGTCWAFAATAAAETSILTRMNATYAETGLDLSERHLAWYVARPVTENISSSQEGEGLHV